jgi:hypothetical protein
MFLEKQKMKFQFSKIQESYKGTSVCHFIDKVPEGVSVTNFKLEKAQEKRKEFESQQLLKKM